MTPGEDYCDFDYGINPYESFMRKHLQHYGYYTGKNQSYKNQFQQFAEWEKNYAYSLNSSSNSTDSDSDEDEKNADMKLQEELLRTTQLIYSCGESGKVIPRLREPRSLYALNKELGPQQAARWPSDLQVINEKVKHIQTVPAEPEPFYKATGFEKCPMVRGEANGGRIVFCYETHSSFFMKSRVGGSRNDCESCSVKLDSESDTTLLFESRYESGNLGKAVQVGENEYELWLRYDLYTNKHTQWFYFRVTNTRKDIEYRFTIVNFMKPDSLYNNGMRPLLYSEKEATISKVGWVRGGQDIKYYKNNLRYESGKADRSYYSLTWTVRFKHDHDTVYFSHCYPYTYTDLQDYLLELTNDPIKSCICQQRVLCQTLAGNLVYVLTITSPSRNPEDVKHKKAIVVTSRVHPGESNASWMMKGFLDFLTGNSPDAKLLRDTFIFKVVPMLNPDGVIVGNYRCSLAGRDLNRNYKTVLKDAYPSVWHTKTMIRKLLQERDIIVYCDLHGHSRRQNVFIYGCEQHHGSNKRFHERIFPFMLSKNSPEKFCFNSCKFKVQKSKENTGRVVMWNLGIMNSYTMEATFCGSSLGKKKGYHFNQNDFEMMGYHFCDTLLDYCDPDNTKFLKILNELEDKHRMELMAKIAQRGLQQEYVDSSDISTDTESSDGGSDSSASNGPPLHLQFTIARQPKRRKLKSKKDRDRVLAGKDEQRKRQSEQEDKKTKNNQIKPIKQDYSKQQAQPVRYTSNTPKRPRSLDDRSNSGIPIFVQERFEEKQQRRHNYLEALTAAYISNNIPLVNDPVPDEIPNMDDLQKSNRVLPASFGLLERRHKPHLLEVSAAQQRQTDALSRDKNGPVKIYPNPFDEMSESVVNVMEKTNFSGPSKSHALSVTSLVNLKLADIKEDTNTSPLAKEEEEQALSQLHPQSSQNHRSRIKTPQTSHSLTTVLNGSQTIQKSTKGPQIGDSTTSDAGITAGIYIQKLIKETKDEIQDLTNEIQDDLEKKHLHKAKNANRSSASYTQKDDVGDHQKVKLDIGYHGSTLVSYPDSSKILKERNSCDFLVGRKMVTTSAASTVDITNIPNQRSAEPSSLNTGVLMPSISSTKLMSSSDLVAGNISHREISKEKSKTRNLQRHASFTGTSAVYVKSSQHSKSTFGLFSLENNSGFSQPEILNQFASPTKDEEGSNLSSKPYIHQLSSNIQSHHQSIQKLPHTNRIRHSQQNLMFHSKASGEQVTSLTQNANHQDERRVDLAESEKKLCLPKFPL